LIRFNIAGSVLCQAGFTESVYSSHFVESRTTLSEPQNRSEAAVMNHYQPDWEAQHLAKAKDQMRAEQPRNDGHLVEAFRTLQAPISIDMQRGESRWRNWH
jgi:hypothetical protein